ncbi:DUF4916 domain-containing protein [Microbacterium sp. X-17]|uniref:DUF4916 domain-containing protein n=1 Tax=Microbacterium sp. X-17 TaxID=3144404 RepID=UPI0031F5824B
MTFLPDELYAEIERSMPIACVDFVPIRQDDPSGATIGLILRDSPFGRVWCHLGGRILRGETLADALRRHADDTLGVELDLPLDPQPLLVYPWYPADVAPADGTPFGEDPRKHAIGLSFVVTMSGVPAPRNEAYEFRFFAPDALPEPMWPGSADLVARLLARYEGVA